MQIKKSGHCKPGLSIAGLMVSTALLFGYVPTVVATEELPREAVLPVSLAATAAKAVVDQCAKDGYRVSAAVVDRAGVLAMSSATFPVGPRMLAAV